MDQHHQDAATSRSPGQLLPTLPKLTNEELPVAELQNSLHGLLRVFIGGYGLSKLSLLTYPYFTRFSKGARDLARDVVHVSRRIEGDRPSADPPPRHPEISKRIGLNEIARVIAQGYRLLDGSINQLIRPSAQHTQVATGVSLGQWQADESIKFSNHVVQSIYGAVNKSSAPHLKSAMIHGSVATHDIVEEFSDLDMAIVITTQCATDPGALLDLRKQIAGWQKHIFLFDPYQHHGPYCITEVDLDFYPQNYFPTELIRHSIELTPHTEPLSYRERNSVMERRSQAVESVNSIVRTASSEDQWPSNFYDLKLLVESTVLLPAYFLMSAHNLAVYKKQSFDIARPYFSADGWRAIDIASEFRTRQGMMNPLPRRFRRLMVSSPFVRTPLAVHHFLRRSDDAPTWLKSKNFFRHTEQFGLEVLSQL